MSVRTAEGQLYIAIGSLDLAPSSRTSSFLSPLLPQPSVVEPRQTLLQRNACTHVNPAALSQKVQDVEVARAAYRSKHLVHIHTSHDDRHSALSSPEYLDGTLGFPVLFPHR